MSSLAALSCVTCRHRKVKCDKSLPACQRCQASNAECLYRSRQPREKKAKKMQTSPSRRLTEDALSVIWDRLRRIEENTERSEFQPRAPVRPGAEIHQYSDTPSVCSTEAGSGKSIIYGSRMSDTASLSPFHLLPAAPTLQSTRHSSSPRTLGEIVTLLKGAVDEAMRLKTEQLATSTMYLLEDVAIPPETARGWVDNFFSNSGPRFWPAIKDEALIDVNLLYMLPDLLQMKHVHVDACMLVIYYCVLWQGQYVTDDTTKERIKEDPHLSRKIYISCLRAISIWQRQAAGSETDFIAATFAAQVAAENLDLHLCWDMHKCACAWSEAMELHSIDSDEPPNHPLLGRTDGGRMGLWNLAQVELFFRLFLNKEAAFSFDMAHWRVNFPFLIFDEEVDIEEVMPSTAFLAGSRVTLILIRFFQKMENNSPCPDRLFEVLSLCQQVEEAVHEWNIFNWQQSYTAQTIDGWFLSELALSCYTSILFMLRKVAQREKLDDDRSRSTTNLDLLAQETNIYASRRVILIVCHMIQVIKLPESPALSLALGLYVVHEAYAYIATHVLDQASAATSQDDLMLLKRFSRCITEVASEATEFVPVAHVLKSLESQLEE